MRDKSEAEEEIYSELKGRCRCLILQIEKLEELTQSMPAFFPLSTF